MRERKNRAVRAASFVLRAFLLPFFRLEADGIENMPETGPFVLLPKHQRWEDIPLLGLTAPRPLYYVAKYELFKNPLISRLLMSLGGIPLNRQRPMESRQSINSVVSYLRRGEGVVVFPEGTYYRERMGPGRSGMIRLILGRLSPPFIPVGIRYLGGGLPIKVNIRFGRPFYAQPENSLNLFVDHMMKEIAELSGLNP